MLLATLLREIFTSPQFDRIPEPDLIMDSEEAVSAFARAGQPNGILSGVYAFYTEQACKMIRPGDRVLDLGCGPALLLSSIAALSPEASFVGVECSAPMIETGNKALRRLGVHNVELRADDMTQLTTFEPGSVDVVLSSMALHHLPDVDHLQRCFDAMDRVMGPNGRVFIADFGRVKSLKSIEYFVRRAIPPHEPVLEHDYRASLRAAFSREEINGAMSDRIRQRISMYSTIVSPVMVILMSPFPAPHNLNANADRILHALPRRRRADYRQLRMSLSLGGMPC